MSNDHVLWIGGPSGTGKSTVARLFARRHGFRWYSCDTRTWEHRDRALAQGDPAAHTWEAMTPDERAALRPADDIRLALDRSQMVLDDLAGLPESPAIVVDGTTVTPDLVGESQAAIWLFASSQARDQRVSQRGWGAWRNPTNEIRARMIEQAVESVGGQRIDTSERTADDILEAVETVTSSWLSQQRHATSARERRHLIREGNMAIVGQYRSGLARPWATADPTSIIRTYDCECAHPTCTELIDQKLSDFPVPFDDGSPALWAPGHTDA